MTGEGPSESTSVAATIFWAFFALVMAGSMVVLIVVLWQEGTRTGDVVRTYVAGVRDGEPVTTGVGGAEAGAITSMLRASASLKVLNFQSQADSACVWVRLDTPDGRNELQFALRGEAVAGVSAVRPCRCPEQHTDPCTLQ